MSIPDRFSSFATGKSDPADDAFPITPSDTEGLDAVTRAIYVGVSGDLAIRTQRGTDVTFTNVPAGTIIPVRAKFVLNTGTDADDLVGLV